MPHPTPALELISEISPEPEAETAAPTPAPFNPQTLFLGGLFIFALLTACYVAASIILPMILAIVLKLVLRPAMKLLHALHVPSYLAAFIVLLILFTGLYGLGASLSTPAASWAQQLPDGISRIRNQLHSLSAPIKATQAAVQNAEVMTQPATAKPVTVTIQGSSLSDRLLTNTQSLLRGVGETFLMLYFLLASGDIFLRRFIEVLPRFRDKRQAVVITQQIESDISAYLAAITVMNILVGLATIGVMMACGISDPLLWGALAFVLNYVPILGPFVGVGLFVVVGIVSHNNLYGVLLPAGLYLGIHMIESAVLTPLLLAKRFTLNPVLITVGIIFWYWMWGVPGAILATPILAVAKIICDRVESLMPIGHFIEG